MAFGPTPWMRRSVRGVAVGQFVVTPGPRELERARGRSADPRRQLPGIVAVVAFAFSRLHGSISGSPAR